MIDVALLGIIRRWYIRDRISIREIARRLDISSNTVRRHIRSDVSEPAYPARRSPSSLDDFTARLSAWLSADAVKSRKQRRTLQQMFLDLRELGYEGSYDQVAAFSRQWKVGQLERVNSASKSTLTMEISPVLKMTINSRTEKLRKSPPRVRGAFLSFKELHYRGIVFGRKKIIYFISLMHTKNFCARGKNRTFPKFRQQVHRLGLKL